MPCVHPKIDLPVISICIEEQKLALFKSNLRILVSIFPGEYPQTSLKVLAHFSRRPVFPWPPQVKNCISVLDYFLQRHGLKVDILQIEKLLFDEVEVICFYIGFRSEEYLELLMQDFLK